MAYSGHSWSRLKHGGPSTTKQTAMPTIWGVSSLGEAFGLTVCCGTAVHVEVADGCEDGYSLPGLLGCSAPYYFAEQLDRERRRSGPCYEHGLLLGRAQGVGPGEEAGLRAGLGGAGRLGEGERMERMKNERIETRLREHTTTVTRVCAHFRAGLCAAAAL